ncbi:MAG: hypothetical protein ACR2IP_11210 [Solirubrobacteraceae bacterium]
MPGHKLQRAMTTDERLIYEARVRMRQAVVAGLAGVLLVVAAVVQISGPQTSVNELTLGLITAHKRFPLDLIGAAINAVGLLAVAGTLSFLFGACRARNPKLQPYIRALAIVGGVLAALTGIVYAVVIAVKANQFATHGSQTYDEAKHLTSSGIFVAGPLLGEATSLVLAVGFVLTALNGLRIGLLTRFMGYLGMFAGVLFLLPLGPPGPVVQAYWLLALAYLLSGRWATGVPAAWRTGRAEKLPSTQELREQRMKTAGGGRTKPAAPTPAPEAAITPSPRSTRATTPKRKRKRRR